MRVTKSILIVFVVSVMVCGIEAMAQKLYNIPPAISEKVVEAVLKCVSEMGFDSSIINQLKEGKYSEDDRVIQALLCTNEKLGFGTADGRVNVDKVMNDLFSNKPDIRAAMEVCEKDYGKGPAETFKTFMICFKEKSQYKIVL